MSTDFIRRSRRSVGMRQDASCMCGCQREAWNRFYSEHRRPWRGVPDYDFPFPEGARVLEVGCGGGKTAKALRDRGYSVTGMDVSEEAVSAFIAMTGLEAVRASICDSPFPDGSFGGVCMVHVLEHLTDAEADAAASEVRRLLAPGGRVFLRTFSPDDARRRRGAPVAEDAVVRGNGILYRYSSADRVRSLFRGMEEVRIEEVADRTRYGARRARVEAVFARGE